MNFFNYINKKIKEISSKTRNAFSLIEIMIVLFIVSLGLVGILSLIVQSIQSSDYNKKNLIAYQLSQEGIELVRRYRDSNWKKDFDFDYGLDLEVDVKRSFCFDYNDSEPVLSSKPCDLNLDDNDFYVHEVVGPSSGYSRIINIELLNEGEAMRVVSEVFFSDRADSESSYATETLLYDWY